MELQQVIDTVKYGELTNISWKACDRVPALISFLNQGLVDLYSKFPLLEKQVIIQQLPQISIYKLTRDFARTNVRSEQLHRYILDTPYEPFVEDILQITGAYEEHGIEIPLNDEHNPNSWFTPSYNTIQIPNANENETAFITYKAKHPYINPETNEMRTPVEVPPCLEEALFTYIAYKSLVSMGSQDTQAQAQFYLQKYDQLCNTVKELNTLGNYVCPSNLKLRWRGFR